mmetsp:Transcript_124621/g.202677  ORF Transcript_124621/g.202677 Transcript_124621/m.202677 type:complete len:321 (-) Transcript_124621:74-1036(-)
MSDEAGMDADAVEAIASDLRDRGNSFFKEEKYSQAADAYREALGYLRGEKLGKVTPGSLVQALRLNLATTLLRLQGDALNTEAVSLCDEVLTVDSECAKAHFLRSIGRRVQAEVLTDFAARKSLLQSARQDALQAARAKPRDRQVRGLLDEITEALRGMSQDGGNSQGGSLAGAFLGNSKSKGLYSDKRASQAEECPPIVCEVCGREGHHRCGKDWWVAQRARWLRVSEEEVGRDPSDFEDDGTLIGLRIAQRAAERLASGGTDADESRRRCDDLSELSEDEREMLEDCLESTERPFPRLKRRLPLAQAVWCAEELWAED